MRIRKRRNSKNAPARNTLATQRDAAPEFASENTASLADLQAQLQKPGTNFQNFATLPTYAPQQQATGGKMPPEMRAIAPTPTRPGQPLPKPIQRKMEGAFGADFSDVRIHQGSQAKSIGAIAYTQGSDIHFQPGKYNPHNPNGQKLLGHELTHVLQQRAGRVSTPQAKGLPINRDSTLETEADQLGAKAAQGETVQVPGVQRQTPPSSQSLIQRDEETPENNTQPKTAARDTPNEKALKNPEQYLKEEANSTWTNVTSKAKKAEPQDNPSGASEELLWVPGGDDKGELKKSGGGMNALLAFRLKETLLKKEDNGNSLLQIVSTKVNKQTAIEYKNKGIKAKPTRLSWNYGAGSDSPTSDIDSNLSGDGTELAVELFNQAFRDKWGKESGIVFDVNVYANNYLPETGTISLIKANEANKLNILKTKNKNTKIPGKKKKLSNQAFAKRGVKFETDIQENRRAYRKDMGVEEVFSLVKVRMDMGKKDWLTYKKAQLKAFDKNSFGFKSLNTRFKQAEQKYKERREAIAEKIDNMDEEAATHSEKIMKAENLVYADKLKQVKDLRLELKKLQEDSTNDLNSLNAIETKSVALKKALYEAYMFANEAYITGGTVKHVVGNKQLLSNRSKAPTQPKTKISKRDKIAKKMRKLENLKKLSLKDGDKSKDRTEELERLFKEKSKDVSNLKIELSVDEYLHSFNEQLGFIFKELNLYKKDKNKALIKSAKYIYRMANAMKHIETETQQTINAPISTQKFRDFAHALFDIKIKGKNKSEVEQLKDKLANSPIDKIKTTLFAISASVQKVYRMWKEGQEQKQGLR